MALPLARSVADVALVAEVLTGRTDLVGALTPEAAASVRIGVAGMWLSGHPDTDAIFAAAIDLLTPAVAGVLSVDVPEVVARHLPGDAANFLGAHGLAVGDISTFVSHPGGPKVIDAIVSSLGLADDALELTWRSLADIGNLSSSSVLHVLRDTIAKGPAAGPGLMMAMGPGFCSERVLMQWD